MKFLVCLLISYISICYSTRVRCCLQQNVKNGSKRAKKLGKKIPGIFQKMISQLNYETYEWNFWQVY